MTDIFYICLKIMLNAILTRWDWAVVLVEVK